MASLSSLFGQKAAIGALRKALDSNCLPGAYLFVGALGVGKGALAQAFAQAVACLEPRRNPFDSCGVCDSCRRAEAGTQPEIVTILPAGEQTQIWQFWERDNRPASGALSRTLSYAPSIGRRRVYIIARAETLTEAAANSLLKVLEEPPSYVQFVLLAPNSASLLPTIVSRCQMIRLSPVPVEELSNYLHDSLGVEAERAGMLAAYAEGRVGQAVRMARTPLVGEEIGRILDLAESIPEAPRVRALRLAEQMRKLATQTKALVGEEATASVDGSEEGETAGSAKEKTSRRQLAAVFDLLLTFYRDLLTLSVSGPETKRLVNRERVTKLYRLACTSEPERWVQCLDALLLARRRLDANANIALVTEVLAMSLVR